MIQDLDLPPTFKADKRGSCVPAAMFLCWKLREGQDFIVEGEVNFGPTAAGKPAQHTWLDIAGEVYDPTLVQFYRFGGYPRVEYRGGERVGIRRYQALTLSVLYLRDDFWARRLPQFGLTREQVIGDGDVKEKLLTLLSGLQYP